MAEPRLLDYEVWRARVSTDPNSRTLFFYVHLGRRSPSHRFFRPHEVPEFEGDRAWFEIDRAKGGWRFVRQVEPRK